MQRKEEHERLGALKRLHLVPVFASVASCTTIVDVRTAELQALGREPASLPVYLTIREFDDVLGYGVNMAEAYIGLADRAQTGQSFAALGIIAAAITGAAGIAFGAGNDFALASAITGGSIFAVDRYLQPGEAAESLLNAAESMLCIVRAGL